MDHALVKQATGRELLIAKEAADWLVDAFATATQDRTFLRGDEQANELNISALEANGLIACLRAMRQLKEDE